MKAVFAPSPPPGLACVTISAPWAANSEYAASIVPRARPSSVINARADGIRSPGFRMPAAIALRNRS